MNRRFSVRITDEQEQLTERNDTLLWVAVASCVADSRTLTMNAFAVGFAAELINEAWLTERQSLALTEFLRVSEIPVCCREDVDNAFRNMSDQ